MPSNLLRQPNFVMLLVLVWLVVALALLLQHWPQTAETLLDTDDAMRLAQLHAWLNGPGLLSGWFDMHVTRMQPPVGFDMHWSRLVDAGLAGLLMVFQVFTDHADAERLMRAWWPLLWLLPTMAGMVAIAWRIAGREAALVALLLALVGVPAYQQFTPGRIDHHNVQIALTFLAVAATVWSDRVRWAAAAAGALSGFALAIGFECVPYLAACGVALALRYIADRYAAPALIAYGLSLAASMLIAFGVDVAPANWARTACDAIAINSAAGAVCGGLVLALVGLLAHPHRVTRIAAVLGAGVAAAAVLLLLEPRCAGGPIALVDPAIGPIWLSDVREMQPLLSVWRTNPLTAAAIATFPAAALLAVLILAGERCAATSGFSPPAWCSWSRQQRWWARSALSPTRCGSACRWSLCWACGCSPLWGSRALSAGWRRDWSSPRWRSRRGRSPSPLPRASTTRTTIPGRPAAPASRPRATHRCAS